MPKGVELHVQWWHFRDLHHQVNMCMRDTSTSIFSTSSKGILFPYTVYRLRCMLSDVIKISSLCWCRLESHQLNEEKLVSGPTAEPSLAPSTASITLHGIDDPPIQCMSGIEALHSLNWWEILGKIRNAIIEFTYALKTKFWSAISPRLKMVWQLPTAALAVLQNYT